MRTCRFSFIWSKKTLFLAAILLLSLLCAVPSYALVRYEYGTYTKGGCNNGSANSSHQLGNTFYEWVVFMPYDESTTQQASVDITVPFYGSIYNGARPNTTLLGTYTGQIPGKITSSALDGALTFYAPSSQSYTCNPPLNSNPYLVVEVNSVYGQGASCEVGSCDDGLVCSATTTTLDVCRPTDTCEPAVSCDDVLASAVAMNGDNLSASFSIDNYAQIAHTTGGSFIDPANLIKKTGSFGYETSDESVSSAELIVSYPALGPGTSKCVPGDVQIPFYKAYSGATPLAVTPSFFGIYRLDDQANCNFNEVIFEEFSPTADQRHHDIFQNNYSFGDEHLFYGVCVHVAWDFSSNPALVKKGNDKGVYFDTNGGTNNAYAQYDEFYLDSTYDPNALVCTCGNGSLQSPQEECDDGNTVDNGNGCLGDCSCAAGYTSNGTGGCTQDVGQVVCGSADGQIYYSASLTAPKSYNSGRTYCTDNTTPSLNEFNGVYTWSCTNETGCTATNIYCDDGVVNGPEACDDGATNDGSNQAGCASGSLCDACSCVGLCGNNVWNQSEQCDYSVPGTTNCTQACTCLPGYSPDGNGNCVQLTACGDGTIQPPEACDDGDDDNTDACTTFCALAKCGDGFVQSYSTGENIGGYSGGTTSCLGVCTSGPKVGSGCDNNTECTVGVQIGICSLFPANPPGYCSVAPYKSCKTDANCDGHGAVCWTAETICPVVEDNSGCYKNGIPNGICTPGNGETPTNCVSDCQQDVSAYSEACDDGNNNSGDGCSSTCTEEIGRKCGDGILVPEAGEECDDGNQIDTDSCTNACKIPDCDPETTYASGTVPGWYCPEGWVLQGCPGAYRCIRRTYAPLMCLEPVCGDGHLELGEFCDASDPTDPNKDICNDLCKRNFCGDGEISTGSIYTEMIRNWNPDQATGLRSIIGSGKVITPGIGGFPVSPKTRELGGFIDLIPDIDQDGITELAVSARGGYQYTPSLNSVSFDDQKNIDALRSYISSTSTYYPSILAMTTLRDLDNAGQGHPELVYAELGCTGSLTTVLISATNPVYNPVTNVRTIDISPYNCSEVKQLTTIGDVDNNGVDDIAFIVNKTNPAPTSMEVAVVLLQNTTSMRKSLRTLTDLGIKRGDNTQILGGIASLGDTDSDGVPDLLVVGQAVGTANQLIARRILLTADIQIKANTDLYKSRVSNGLRELFPYYLPDIDGDSVRDIVIVHDYKASDDTEMTLLRMRSDWTVYKDHTLDLGISPDGGNDGIRLQDISYITIASGGNLVLGDKWAFPIGNGSSKGALYLYPLQAPYGHIVTTTGLAETCDEGSYCDDLVTRCEDDPSSCDGGSTHCLPRYINGCTATCQGGCGNGTLDPAGVNGILGDSDDEQCDDANTVDADACSNTCKRPYCGDGIVTYEAYRTGQNGALTGYYEHCDRSVTGNGGCPITCQLSGNINALCNYTFAARLAYGQETFTGLNAVGHLCYPVGIQATASGHTLNTSGDIITRNRTCEGVGSGNDAQCSLSRWACGDGVVDQRPGMTTQEQCDDGNLLPGDGCDSTCKFEPWITSEVLNTSGMCTVGSYPQVEEGEYLPVWFQGNTSFHVTETTNCTTASTNSLMRSTLLCSIEIVRGKAGNTEPEVVGSGINIPCAKLSTTGASMIADALDDFTDGALNTGDLVGSYLFSTGDLIPWIHYGGVASYGQYQLRVTGISGSYCAKFRSSDLGTVSGTVTAMTGFELCDNNADDNGNGYVDCADVALCSSAPNCGPVVIPAGGTEESCTDTPGVDEDGNGLWNCNDPACVNAPNCQSWILPEHCANGIDDNNNSMIDCEGDPTCYWTPYCQSKKVNPGQDCGMTGDSEGDGFGGCNDPECMSGNQLCYPLNPLQCNNAPNNDEPMGIGGSYSDPDNDSYGGIDLVDKLDPQCILSGFNGLPPIEQTTYCNGTMTNVCSSNKECQFVSAKCRGIMPTENNNYNDPFPYLQRNFTLLPEAICGDGVDNDGDGWVDCSDRDCRYNTDFCGVGSPPPPPAGSINILGEITGTGCTDGIDNEGDGFIDCSDGECSLSPGCQPLPLPGGTNVVCFSGGVLRNVGDPACAIFHGTGHVPEPPISRSPQIAIYTGEEGKDNICSAGFSVSKGYFVQQGFALSEEASTGLDVSSFTNIGGVSLVAEGTAVDVDNAITQLATYQGAGKKYLFDDFIDTWQIKAVNTVYINNTRNFKKVPNAHIYFWEPTPFKYRLLMNQDMIDMMLRKGGAEELQIQNHTVPFTLVVPLSGQSIKIVGSIEGNGMFVSKGDIHLASSQENGCDGSDSVEGLFIAGGKFSTDIIGNRSLTATGRCAGGNLQIKGTLMGMNAGSSLAPLRRSVINAWATGNLLFDNSLIYQAKELFETCYLPALAHKKGSLINTTAGFTNHTGPLGSCNISGLQNTTHRTNLIAISHSVMTDFLDRFVMHILGTVLTCGPDLSPTHICVPMIDFVLPMMDKVQNVNSPFVIPGRINIKYNSSSPGHIDPITGDANDPWTGDDTTLLGKMQATGRRFPAWWFNTVTGADGNTYNIDLQNTGHRQLMTQIVGRAFGDIKDMFLGFPSLAQQASGQFNLLQTKYNINLSQTQTLVMKLYKTFESAYLNTLTQNLICSEAHSKPGYYNGFICLPDMKRLRDKRPYALTEGSSKASTIIEGSSVVIQSQPKLWTDLPPGAKEFLNTLVVVPR